MRHFQIFRRTVIGVLLAIPSLCWGASETDCLQRLGVPRQLPLFEENRTIQTCHLGEAYFDLESLNWISHPRDYHLSKAFRIFLRMAEATPVPRPEISPELSIDTICARFGGKELSSFYGYEILHLCEFEEDDSIIDTVSMYFGHHTEHTNSLSTLLDSIDDSSLPPPPPFQIRQPSLSVEDLEQVRSKLVEIRKVKGWTYARLAQELSRYSMRSTEFTYKETLDLESRSIPVDQSLAAAAIKAFNLWLD